jgi:hypothetical protein
MPNYELGFGSPFYTNQPNGDMGFGAPYSITVGATSYSTIVEQGFGDIQEFIQSFIGGELTEFGDEGGHLVKLHADWKLLFPINYEFAGPFKIQLIKDENPTPCISGLPGQQEKTWADNIGRTLCFSLPSGLEQGTYDIEIYYGPDFSQKIEILSALQIKNGLRDLNVKNIKNNMPNFYKLNDKNDYGYGIKTQYDDKDKKNIEKIIEIIGEELSTIIPAKYTILTQLAEFDDNVLHVETTLNFPNIGLIKCGVEELIYTSKTATTFILKTPIKKEIPKFTTVNLLNDNIEKIDNYYLRQVYQYVKPNSFTVKNDLWDECFRYLQFADRHVFPNIYNYYSLLTSQYDWSHPCLLANANTQVFIIEDINKEFNISHVDRFVEIDNIVYYAERLVPTAHISNPAITVNGLKLVSACETSLFRKSQFTNFSKVYQLSVKPFNVNKDYDGKFFIEYEDTIFPSTPGFIDLNYIDAENVGIYFDNKQGIGDNNILISLTAGIEGKINRKRKTSANFGTYIIPSDNPDFVGLEPDNELQ